VQRRESSGAEAVPAERPAEDSRQEIKQGVNTMKLPTFAGHPVHPQLVGIPIGLLPFSLSMDIGYHMTGRQSFADAAYYSLAGGTGGALAAGAAGAVDYFSIPSGGESKQTANTHAGLNLAVMAVYGLSLATRRQDRRPSAAATALSAMGAAGLIVSQWYGGHLVYEHGMRVGEEEEQRGRLPGDRAVESAAMRSAEAMPAGGPAYEGGE
jgi:uncharacterized membrane protein